MYIPPHFAESRPEVLQRIIRDHPLGMLVTQGVEGFDADHVPFEFEPGVDGRGVLVAHVARANPVWQRCAGASVMVVFRGAEAYVSPNWYPSKHETHRQVPTWNYEVVHAHGTLTVQDDERFVRGVVARLTRRHEADAQIDAQIDTQTAAQEGAFRPWKMGDSSPEFIDGLLRSIVGIEVAVTSIVGKVKLSQNKEARDREGAADQLALRGADEMARLMRP